MNRTSVRIPANNTQIPFSTPDNYDDYCMKFLSSLFVSLIVSLLLAGCYSDPDFDNVPRLTDISIYTKSVTNVSDSLVIRVGFEDGDGDLGIIGNENEPFFRIPNPNTGQLYWIYDKDDPDLPPYSCEIYDYVTLTPEDTIRDTLLIERNEAYFNFNVTLFTKEDGQYQEVNFAGPPLCTTPLGGRFFPLRDDFSNDSPLKGVIQWGTVGAYSALYRNDTLRIDVTVRDRAGHVSNVITYADFTLNGVRRTDGE